jgi:hypothetical protein
MRWHGGAYDGKVPHSPKYFFSKIGITEVKRNVLTGASFLGSYCRDFWKKQMVWQKESRDLLEGDVEKGCVLHGVERF